MTCENVDVKPIFIMESPGTREIGMVQTQGTPQIQATHPTPQGSSSTTKKDTPQVGLIQCSLKVSFHPETGPEFPQNEKNPKIFGTSLSL